VNMLASRRWRDWSPIENISKSSECELTELTKTPPEPILSVLSVPTLPISENSEQSDGLPEHDLDAQRGSFFAWMNVACAFHARVFGGVPKLPSPIANGSMPEAVFRATERRLCAFWKRRAFLWGTLAVCFSFRA